MARHGRGVIAVDALYSTNGSVAPLAELADIAAHTGCVLIVDESHSLGTHGPRGAGLVDPAWILAQALAGDAYGPVAIQ